MKLEVVHIKIATNFLRFNLGLLFIDNFRLLSSIPGLDISKTVANLFLMGLQLSLQSNEKWNNSLVCAQLEFVREKMGN
jgi:hypothetical protein